MKHVDVIVAVRDEEASLPSFVSRIDALDLPQGVRLRLLLVEDSSRDGTIELLRTLSTTRDDIAFVSLVRGYGQGIAVSYGLSRSDADAMVMMDVDGSHPPEAIPALIAAYLDGAKVAQCVRRTLTDRTPLRVHGAAAFHFLSRLVFGVDVREQNIFYRLVSREVADMILAEPRYWPYLRFPLPRKSPGETRLIEIDTAERVHGESKYDFLRLVNLAVDGVLSLLSRGRARVLAAMTLTAGFACFAAGLWPLGLGVWLLLARLVARDRQIGRGDALRRIVVREEVNVPAASQASPA